jgi:hypothetical protein
MRRQIAKMAMERLIQDGRIHPARIEDIIKKVEQELETQIREIGEQATFDAGVHGIHPDIIRILGQLKYRTSFSQNVLQHSLEVASLCGMMAAERRCTTIRAHSTWASRRRTVEPRYQYLPARTRATRREFSKRTNPVSFRFCWFQLRHWTEQSSSRADIWHYAPPRVERPF